MENLSLLIFIGLVLMLILFNNNREPFSTSGLAISDRYCNKLASVYYDPKNNDPACRASGAQRICGRQRRSTIDNITGNYFYDYGVLI